MSNIPLTLACWDYDRTRPLIDGRIRPDGIDLTVTVMRPRDAFHRMLETGEFDICEMSLASHAILKSVGDNRFVGLPVALSKMFRHSCLYIRTGIGIHEPVNLRGRRVGTSRYSSTGLVFLRGMLQHEHGITSKDVKWCIGPLNDLAEKAAIPPNLPHEIAITVAPNGQTLEDMFAAGELDALLSNYIPGLFLQPASGIARLFPDYKRVEQDYYRRTRIFPVMHIVVLRADIYRRDPWVAQSLYQAFWQAKDLALKGLYDSDALHLAFPWLLRHVEEAREIFGNDYWSYGFEANRPALNAIGQYLYEQGLASRAVAAEDLFAPELI